MPVHEHPYLVGVGAAVRVRRTRPALLAVGLVLGTLVCGVRAWAQQEGDLRLVDGTSPERGRVEIHHDGEWGSICNSGFGRSEVKVVCRQLGYARAVDPMGRDDVVDGTGRIWLSGLECTGTESFLADCVHLGWGNHHCGHHSDAGVVCGTAAPRVELAVVPPAVLESSSGERVTLTATLAGGAAAAATTLTIAVRGPTAEFAAVADFPLTIAVGSATGTASFTLAPEDDSEHETDDWVTVNGTGAGLTVAGTGLAIANDDKARIRLLDGSTLGSGRVEVSNNGLWQPVCADEFGRADAEVVCRQLGHGAPLGSPYRVPSGGPYWLDDVNCSGTENYLSDCPHLLGWGLYYCASRGAVAVRCHTDQVVGVDVSAGSNALTASWTAVPDATGYQVQWKSGDQDYAATRQQVVSGQATVSATIPNLSAGTVYTVRVLATFMDGTDGPPSPEVTGTPRPAGVRLTVSPETVAEGVEGDARTVTVTGTLEAGVAQQATPVTVSVRGDTAGTSDFVAVEEFTLTIAAGSAEGTATFALAPEDDAEHEDDETVAVTGMAGSLRVFATEVTITNDDHARLRLVGGSGPESGRLEVSHNHEWGAVCHHEFGTEDGAVVCRQLDYKGVNRVTTVAMAGIARSDWAWLAGLNCGGSEQYLSDCGNWGWIRRSQCANHVALSCGAGTVRLTATPREVDESAAATGQAVTVTGALVGRTAETSTVVTVSVSGDTAQEGLDFAPVSDFTLTIAEGAESGAATFTLTTIPETHAEARETVRITGTAEGLTVHGTVVRITEETRLHAPLRLMGSDTHGWGRLEVLYDGQWGRICDDYFGTFDAVVACRQLGFAGAEVWHKPPRSWYHGGPPIWLDDLACTGTERYLSDCPHPGWGNHDCGHLEDTGVKCSETVTLSIIDRRETESADELRLVVELTPTNTGTVTVHYATADGTATAGEDYTEASGTLTFATTVTRQPVVVTLLGDPADEPDETFTLTLSSPQGAELGDASGTGTIEDDDEPPQRQRRAVAAEFGSGPYAAAEGGAAAAVLVRLSDAPEGEVAIPLTVRNKGGAAAVDYAVAKTVRFAGGQVTATVTVTAVDDAVDDDGESVELGFGELPAGVTAGSPGTAVVSLSDDDERGVRVSESALTVLEGGSNDYTVELASEPTASVTVTVGVPAGTDVSASPRELTFTAGTWNEAQPVTVRALEDPDALADAAVSLTHAVSGGDYGAVTASAVTVTVAENDTPALSMAGASGAESVGELGFVVSLNLESGDEVTVKYATADGTAQEGADYTEASGTLTLAAGARRGTVTVAVLDDTADEAEEETFTVTLSGASGALLAVAQATGTIEDDDEPQVAVRFGAASYAAAEGGSAAVEVRLSGDPEREVEIPLTVQSAGGAVAGDYTVSAQRLTLNSGRQTAQVTVTAVDDAVDDDGESVELGFGELPAGVTAGSPGTAEVSLGDDDERGVTVSERELTVLEGGSNVYTVELASEPTMAVTVAVGVPGGTDVAASPRALTFTAVTWDTAQTVTVRAEEDADALADAAVSVTHAASGGDYGAVTGPAVTVTVVENDTPALSIAGASGAESAGELGFVVSLSLASADEVTVKYATADGTAQAGTDYTQASGTLTLAAGAMRGTVTVEVLDDAADEVEEETFTVTLSGASGALLAVAQATGTIADDDEPRVAVRFGAASYAAAEGGSVAVEVSLNGDPEREVEIPLTVQGAGGAVAGDYTVSAQRLTLNSGRQTARVTVTAVDDAVDDDGESVELGFGELSAGVTAGSPGTARVSLTDDDERGVRVSESALTVLEGGSNVYTVELATEPTAAVTVAVGVAAGTDVSARPRALTFTSVTWDEGQTVTVRAEEDADALADAAVSLTHAASGGDYGAVTGPAVTVTVVRGDGSGSDSDGGGERHAGAEHSGSERRRVGGRAGVRGEAEPGERGCGDGGVRDGGRDGAGGSGLHGGERDADAGGGSDARDDHGGGAERRGGRGGGDVHGGAQRRQRSAAGSGASDGADRRRRCGGRADRAGVDGTGGHGSREHFGSRGLSTGRQQDCRGGGCRRRCQADGRERRTIGPAVCGSGAERRNAAGHRRAHRFRGPRNGNRRPAEAGRERTACGAGRGSCPAADMGCGGRAVGGSGGPADRTG